MAEYKLCVLLGLFRRGPTIIYLTFICAACAVTYFYIKMVEANLETPPRPPTPKPRRPPSRIWTRGKWRKIGMFMDDIQNIWKRFKKQMDCGISIRIPRLKKRIPVNSVWVKGVLPFAYASLGVSFYFVLFFHFISFFSPHLFL